MAAVAFTGVAVFTVAVTFMAALRARALYRNDHSILGMDFVMIMTASSVTILHSVSPGRGITTPTMFTTIATTMIPLPIPVT
jgi:hypothetical protein